MLDAVVAALAHPARRQILLTVHFRGGEATSGEIAGRFAHKWPTTTRHLRVLELAGLLRLEQRGRRLFFHRWIASGSGSRVHRSGGDPAWSEGGDY